MKLQMNSVYDANRTKGSRKRKKKHRKNKGHHHSKKQSFNNRYGNWSCSKW